VKSTMLKALLAAGVISDINDPKWHSMSAQEAAKMLADADIDPSKITDPALAAAIRLAKRVAAGDVHAAREVVAHAVALKEAHAEHFENALSEARAAVANKDLKDPEFNSQARQAMLKALAATGLIADIHDPKWQNMSAEEVAKMLADADIDPSKIKDPAVAAAIRLAKRVAAGDVHAAREVAAHAIASKVLEHEENTEERLEIHAALAKQTLKDPHFNEHVKSTMLEALLAAGAISDINDPKWHSISSEEAAKMLANADIDPSKIMDPAVAAAIRFAHQQADAEHFENALSEARAAVADKDLKDPEFNSQARQAILKALVATGLVADIHDPKLQSMTAEEVAWMLANAKIDPAKIKGPAVPAVALSVQLAN